MVKAVGPVLEIGRGKVEVVGSSSGAKGKGMLMFCYGLRRNSLAMVE